ncbi:MAG: cyclase family protein [Chlorobiaceae bacterium]
MRVFDLSRTIEPGMPCYPGTPEPEFHLLSSIEKDGFAEQQFTLSSHTGTHVDLPSHILPAGRSLDDCSLDRFIGKGFAIDLRDSVSGAITIEALQVFQDQLQKCEFLLLCSGWSKFWGTAEYYTGYPVLSSAAALWLGGFQLKGIGVDMISVDASDSGDFPVHRTLLEKGILLIENLADLSPLFGTSFTFFAFPLKIAHAEASPLRAVAIVDDKP